MSPDHEHAFLVDGGSVADFVRSMDWSGSVLGPIPKWPSTLKTLLATILRAPHPMLLWWGTELIQFYNDAFVPSLGVGKHPSALGQRGRESWAEVWPLVGEQIENVMARGASFWSEDALVPIIRNGRIEEVHWTYGYSPVVDHEGRIAGTLIVCNETTSRIVAERRLGTVRAFVEKTATSVEVPSLMQAAFTVIANAPYDIPFALAYRVDDASGMARREISTDLQPATLDSLDAVVREHVAPGRPKEPTLVSLPASSRFPGGPWPEASSEAFVVPLTGSRGLTFVLGVSPRLPFDTTYLGFLTHFVEQIDLAITRVRAIKSQGGMEIERRNLLLQAPMPTALMTGPRHVFELANESYERMVGRRVVGKSYLEAFPELEGTELPAIHDEVYRTGHPYVAPESKVRLDRDGDGHLEDGFFRFNLEPLRDGDGHIYGMMAVAFDITEQVNARRTLEEAVAEARRLNDKAVQAEDELTALLRQLETANRAKDEFLATVSHELRTPLNAILGWSRLLREGSDPVRVQKGLTVIERNAKAQAQLIEDLLDVSRIISGKIRMSLKRVDLTAIANAAVETAQPSAVARGVRLNVSVEPGIGVIVADEDRLQQVIWNLLSNAVKFTSKGGDVTLRLARVESQVRITVRDSGIGISPAFLPRVFDRFRQDDSSTTRQHAGLGLGLAIVRHLVELHGGTVAARSDGDGKGSTFEVHLPIRAVEPYASRASRDASGDTPPSAKTGASGRLRGIHVLIVDDQEDARDLVATVLEDSGARVLQADSVSAAIKLLSTAQVGVIVSDIGMPGEDGYGFLQRLRSTADAPGARGVPALALTAYARGEDRDKALASGFQEHVAKPIDPARLVEVVAGLVRR
jgi:signal transduction histidine kinase